MFRSAVVLALSLVALAVAPAAQAAEIDSTCASLQDDLTNADNGDVFNVTEDQCDNAAYTIPGSVDLTINGAPSGTIFDGGAVNIFDVAGSAGTLTFRNMIVRVSVPGTSGISAASSGNERITI